MHYLVLVIFVLIAGIIPIFGPPSWVFAVYYRQFYDLSPVLVVLLTAFATAIGRLVLALITRKLKPRIPKKYVNNLEYSQQLLLKKRKSLWAIIGLFVLSPLPSAQLFEGAGLINVPILPLSVAFFIGRIFSLSIYLSLAHLAAHNIDSLWKTGLTSIWTIAFEVVAIISLLALFNLRLIRHWFKKRRQGKDKPSV